MSDQLEKKEIAKQYVKASVHYGHPPREWNPKMAPYILYEKYGYHIFDLVKTSKLLRLAGNVLQKSAEKNGKFLFVGTNRVSIEVEGSFGGSVNTIVWILRSRGGVCGSRFASINKGIYNSRKVAW